MWHVYFVDHHNYNSYNMIHIKVYMDVTNGCEIMMSCQKQSYKILSVVIDWDISW